MQSLRFVLQLGKFSVNIIFHDSPDENKSLGYAPAPQPRGSRGGGSFKVRRLRSDENTSPRLRELRQIPRPRRFRHRQNDGKEGRQSQGARERGGGSLGRSEFQKNRN